jgi:Bifunctional DNA primase/polymerase, N-terminal
MSRPTTDTPSLSTLQAALDYAALGWPVVPGAIWRDGHFASPVDGQPVTSPCLRPVTRATTDADVVRQWWSVPGLHEPNVFTVTGSELGAFGVFADLTEAVIRHPRFDVDPTPVFAIQEMPLAYFLVRPPSPSVLLSSDAQILDPGTPVPLPPSTIGSIEAFWLVTPEEAGNVLMPGDVLAGLIREVERK